jgi:uncharacterized radical SAM superfamily Fe-S cluster-containing enzyme
MVEVTNKCNMECPVCFADANHHTAHVSLQEIRHRMKQILECTCIPIPIQISGGEPTMRDDLPEIIGIAKELGFRNIELVTNGIMISLRPGLLVEFKEKGLTAVYLQFDGLEKKTYKKIRGRDMTKVRARAVEVIRDAGLQCTLAVTVVRGINDHEVGDIVKFCIDNIDTVRAVNFQSATRFTGRFEVAKQQEGYSLPELLNLIETQAGVPAHTFRSEHMGHPLCNTMSLVFVIKGKLKPLFKYINQKDLLEFLGDNPRERVLNLFKGKNAYIYYCLRKPNVWKLLIKVLPLFRYNPGNFLKSRHILLFAKSFIENDKMDPERVHQCCYGISDNKGVYSFCAFNNLYRFPDRISS